MKRILASLLVVCAVTACGQSSPALNPIGASSITTSRQFVIADFPVTDGVSCPSDAPQFEVIGNSYGHLDITVQRMPQTDYIRIYIQRREVDNVFHPIDASPYVLDHDRTYVEIPVGNGIYLVQVATVTCGIERNLSAGEVVGVGQEAPISGPVTEPTPESNPEQPAPTVTSYVSYWRMRQGNDNARQHACTNHGGTWLNSYDIPGDNVHGKREDVCRIVSTSTNPHKVTPTGNASDIYNPPGFVPVP